LNLYPSRGEVEWEGIETNHREKSSTRNEKKKSFEKTEPKIC